MAGSITPEAYERCVTQLTMRLRDIAMRAGVPEDECSDLEATLEVLPPFARERASVLLEGVRAHSDDKCMSVAAGFLLTVAHEVWNAPYAAPTKTRFSRSSQT